MNEFIEQFVIESRELIEQASADLLALERAPQDRERLDAVFRAFHTLKGGAAIVDFAAMEHALHGAENGLSTARSGSRALSKADIDDCLFCLDRVSAWLDFTESEGAFPDEAQAAGAAIVERFARWESGVPAAPARSGTAGISPGWVKRLLGARPAAASRALSAVRYVPPEDCFFQGVDPLAVMAALPGLLALEVEPRSPWPGVESLDPFACQLVLEALLEAPRAQVVEALGEAASQSEVVTLAEPAGNEALGADARALLEAQVELLAGPGAQPGERGAEGRLASAGVAAVNVLRHAARVAQAGHIAAVAAEALQRGEPQLLSDALRDVLSVAEPSPSDVALAEPSASAVRHVPEAAAQTLRVEAARVDSLVRLTGELTVAKNAIGLVAREAQAAGSGLAGVLTSRHATLERLVSELQRAVLAIRVLPMRVSFQRFPRLIRELAADLGKAVSLVMEGEDTEADKAVVEALAEPLVHVLRNAMDHGIEAGAVRLAAGKTATASITLRAAHRGDHVVVEVADDGGGIDVARVRQVARERSVLPVEEIDAMTDAQAIDLIFAPGFSTAREVTGVSGRGVGMDAVRSAVRRLGGQVELDSTAGQGTTVRFTLPFTVMVTPVMTVEAGGQAYGIPLDAIVETIRIHPDRIAPVGAARAIVYRESTIPLVALSGALGVHRNEASGGRDATVIIVRFDAGLGALEVDRLGERMDIMLKPLDGLLSGMPGLAGSTLLGDGSVLLVLDLSELLR